MATITIELPDDLVPGSGHSHEEFFNEMRVAAAIRWYLEERITEVKAAELAGLDRVKFQATLARAKAETFQCTPRATTKENETVLEANGEPLTAHSVDSRGTL